MRFSALLLLPLLVAAEQQQQPLKDKAGEWVDRAKQYADSAVPAAADAVASQLVTRINSRNWRRKLSPKVEGPEEWAVLVTGGNKTCHGNCEDLDEAWNLAVPQLAAMPSAPHLGLLNCEVELTLCASWSTIVPSLWHFSFPQKASNPDDSTPKTPIYIAPLNITSISSADLVRLISEKGYLKEGEFYDGAFHPIDGWLEKFGLLTPVGWVLWGMSTTPSWLLMIGLSFFSRQWASRRMNQNIPAPAPGGIGGPVPGAAAAAPASPPPAPAAKAKAPGSSKKRK